MLKYESPTRSIPTTTQSQDLFMLQQAKMRVERNYLNDVNGINNRDSRYNVKLTDTIDQDRVNRNVDVACNRQKYVPPKVANKSAHPDNNIAIYDLHAADINNQHILGNLLPEKYKYDSQRKIQQPNSWVKDYDYISQSFEDSGLPERYTQGEEIQTFPLNKEAFESRFNELVNKQTESFTTGEDRDANKVRNPYYTFMGRSKPNLHSETANDINTYGYNIDNTTNGNYNGYLDTLTPSSTNLPTQPFENYAADEGLPNAARFPDERLQQNLQTYQRQFRDENSRVVAGWNLYKSDYMKERNARQREADIALQHNGAFKIPTIKTADYIDFLDAQTRGENQPVFNEEDYLDGLATRYNERNKGGYKLSQKPSKQPTANTIKLDNSHGVEQAGWHRQGNITSKNVMNTLNDKQHNDNEIENYKYTVKQVADNNVSMNGTYHKTTKPDEWQSVRHRPIQYRLDNKVNNVGNYFNEYNKNNKELFTYINDKQQLHQRTLEDGNINNKNQVGDSNYPLINLIRGQGIVPKESFNKAEHILITRTGNIQNVYTDPNIDEVAPVLITVDEQNRPIRTFATLAKNNLTIIQKYDPTYLDIANGDYYKDDFIALTIPIDSLPSHLQNNINKAHKQQTSSNRKNPNKVLEMGFDDLLELSKVIINEKDKTKRIKIDTLKGYFKDNKFDEQLLYGYAEKTFTTPWVVDKIEKSERMKLDDRNRVVQKNYYSVDNGQDIIPKSSHAMSGARKDILMDENKPFIDKKQTSMKNEQFNHRDLYFDEI